MPRATATVLHLLFPAVCLLVRGASAAAVSIAPRPAPVFGTWEGWGVSLAWWANVWGDVPELSDMVWTRADSISLPGLTPAVPGLGLNIARYNAGGSSNTSALGRHIVYSQHMPWWKGIQGFWLNPTSDDPASSSWDWSADANQVLALRSAVARGADVLELFSNSPMWWQLGNDNPSGSATGGDNLLPAYYQAHARYLATIAAHARSSWGVNFSSVELFNEPAGGWWKAAGTQEGCDFKASSQAAVLAGLPYELTRAGFSPGSIRIAASDESTIDMAVGTWKSFGATTRKVIDQVNVHGYENGGPRAELYNEAVVDGGKILRDSEFGDGDGTGGKMALSILLDWALLHPRGWCYWQILDEAGGWGMLQAAASPRKLELVNTKHFVLAQFSRHIRPGMAILLGGDARNATAAAWDAARGLLVLVTQNYSSDPIEVDVCLGAFLTLPAPGTAVAQWRTSTASATPDASAAYTPVTGASMAANKCLTPLTLPAWTVATLEVPGVFA